MKPFNLAEALAGKPVINGFGQRVFVTKLAIHSEHTGQLISQRENGGVLSYHFLDGECVNKYVGNAYRLYMAPTTVTKWVNLFSMSKGYQEYDSEEEANRDTIIQPTIGITYPRQGNKAHKITYEE